MRKFLLNCLVITVTISALFICGCNDNNETQSASMINQKKLQNSDNLTCLSGLYNDKYKYFLSTTRIYYTLDDLGELYVDCKDASCEHDNDKCDAYLSTGQYFVFNDKLYKSYNDIKYTSDSMLFEGKIIDVSTQKQVFDNPVPEDMDKEQTMDDSSEIYSVGVISEDYIKVEGHRHAYILDKEFNIVCWYGDVGKYTWGMLDGNKFFYVNDIYQLAYVELDTGKVDYIDLREKVTFADNDDNYIFFSNEYGELFKCDKKDYSIIKIANETILFSVHGDYIYCDMGYGTKKIIDKNGSIIADYTEKVNMGTDGVIMIGDKIYTCFENGVAQMDADGSNYKEYMLND